MNKAEIKQALWIAVKNRAAAIDPIEVIGLAAVETEGRPLSQKDRDSAVKLHKKIVNELEKKGKQ